MSTEVRELRRRLTDPAQSIDQELVTITGLAAGLISHTLSDLGPGLIAVVQKRVLTGNIEREDSSPSMRQRHRNWRRGLLAAFLLQIHHVVGRIDDITLGRSLSRHHDFPRPL